MTRPTQTTRLAFGRDRAAYEGVYDSSAITQPMTRVVVKRGLSGRMWLALATIGAVSAVVVYWVMGVGL